MNYFDYLNDFHPGDAEFHQAVKEVFEDVETFYAQNPEYQKHNIFERLMEPDRIIRFRVTWEDDNKNIQVNRAWRVQFNNALGAYKGGLRFHPTVNESVLKFLGFEQCFKNALTGLPMGGAKGGSDFNPKGRSSSEVRRFCSAMMTELHRHIGSEVDVPAGDINVGTREIGYLFGTYLKIENRWEGVLTGKSPTFGGSCGREEATGHGVVYFLEQVLHAHDEAMEDKKVLISGSGNVALFCAEKALQKKMRVLTVSDSKGFLLFKDGMTEKDLEVLKTLKFQERKRLSEAQVGEYHNGKSPWSVKADVAIPCATENEVDAHEAQQLIDHNILVVIEGANMPLTAEAQALMIKHHVIYVPGKAANAGGVAVSGFERTQNASMQSWSLTQVDQALKDIMRDIHERSVKFVEKENGVYPYRKGANIYGFQKLADTLLAYGLK